MSDYVKSMDNQIICNQRVVTENKLLGMRPIGLSAPWADYKNKQLFTNIKM